MTEVTPVTTPHVFDAAAILGIGTPSTELLPDPEEGFVTLVIPDGLSLQTLRDSDVGKKLMHRQDWYDEYHWSSQTLPAGIYRLRIPVLASGRKTAGEQVAMLPAGETLAPVVLVATALLCIRLQGGSDPLNYAWTRCAEHLADCDHVVLSWSGGRLYVYVGFWDDDRLDSLVASSLRTS